VRSLPHERQGPSPCAVWHRNAWAVALAVAVTLGASCTQSRQSADTTASSEDLPFGAVPHPVNAVEAVAHALRSHPLVAIGESHNLREAGGFYDALIADPAVAAELDDIVVEFGNSRYQSTIDRYVAGRTVSSPQLKKVWRDTTQVGAWDAPMYAAFFAAVRRANAGAEGNDIRVLLGDPPIDWNHTHSEHQVHRLLLRRERFMARIIVRDVLDHGERAIVIAGLAHVERSVVQTDHPNVTGIIDRTRPGAMFVVGTHLGFPKTSWEQALSSWSSPAIASLEGTWIGRLPKGEGLAEDALDAMLFLGLPDSLHLSIPLPSVYRDDLYWHELKRRWELSGTGRFSAAALLRSFSGAGYPGQFTRQGIQRLEDFARCMRQQGVAEFPAPQFQYDAAGFFGDSIQQAMKDPWFEAALAVCDP
jgi:hypothetical protein